MRNKILYSLIALFILLIIVISIIFIRVVVQSSETITRLREERKPQKIEISEIPLKKKKGWELFVNKADVRDMVFFNRKYYLATSGGIILLSEDCKIEDEFNTNWGLPENSFLELYNREDNILALTEGGKLIELREKLLFKYNLKRTGKIFSFTSKESDIFLSAANGIYLLSNGKISKIEDIKDVKIVRHFLNGIVVGTIHGKVYISTPTFTDSLIEIDAVNDIKENGEVLYIATPLGLERVTREERKLEFAGEFITTIAEYNGKLCCGTFDGRVIVGKKIYRIAKKSTRINRLRVINDKLFALTSDGAFLLEDGKWSCFYKPYIDIPLMYITSILKKGNELFIGTFENGCFSLKSNGLRQLEIGKNVNEINQIVGAQNELFIATNSGLFLLSQKGVKKIDGLPSNFVNAIFLMKKKLIVGTSKGFGILDLNRFESKIFGSFQGLINNRVYSIAYSEGKIILGTLGGISIFDGNSFKNVTSANSSLKCNWINGLLVAGERIYIGTYGGGISYLEKKGIKTIEETSEAEINHNSLFCKEPYLLAGTCKNGLFVYNEKNNKGKFLKGIFPLDDVTAVFADEEYFYIGTEQGLYRIESKEMPLDSGKIVRSK
ncbi:hypothetical protein KAU34_07715 [candidate division WOR-3 bacterium]|nr:hypothetical protein [candidate division WOR-3 bacterium]